MGLFSLVGKIKIEGAEQSVKQIEGVKSSTEKLASTLKNDLGSSTSAVTKNLASVENSAKSLSGVMAGVAITAAIALAAAVKVGASAALESAASYDSLVRGLATVATSSEDLRGQLTRLREVAKLPGIGFQEAVQGSLQLQAVGISAKLAERTLVGFANAVARSGGSKMDFSESLRQMTQMASVSKLSMEDLKVISQRIPGFSRIIQQAFGTNDNEKINAMGLSATQMIEKITLALEKLPKASGGIRNALDNMKDLIDSKVMNPLGRVTAAFAGAFGSGLEKLINAAAPGFERMAAAAEKLSRSNLATFFSSAVGNIKAFNAVISITAGILTAAAVSRAIPTIISGIAAMVNAFKALRIALQTTALADIIMEAIATKGASLFAVGAALSAAIGVAAGVNSQLNKLFGDAQNSGPYIPDGVTTSGGGGALGAVASAVQSAIDAMNQQQLEKLKTQERYMLAIEKNTAKTANALDMRRQTLGGSELGKIGVTAAEIRGGSSGGLYAPPETFSRPVAAEFERMVDKRARQYQAKRGMVGRPRAA